MAKAYPAAKVALGLRTPTNALVIWWRQGGGHIEIQEGEWKNMGATTISANSGGGSWWNGEGVVRHHIKYNPHTKGRRITHFINVEY